MRRSRRTTIEMARCGGVGARPDRPGRVRAARGSASATRPSLKRNPLTPPVATVETARRVEVHPHSSIVHSYPRSICGHAGPTPNQSSSDVHL